MAEPERRPLAALLKAALPAAFVTLYLFNVAAALWNTLPAFAAAPVTTLLAAGGHIFVQAVRTFLQFIVALPAMLPSLIAGYHAAAWLQRDGTDDYRLWLACGAGAGLVGTACLMIIARPDDLATGLYITALHACAGMVAAHQYRHNIKSEGHYN